ncbi:VCBS domain-containing protein [Vibrio chagasii]|nr:VCBS domain-containing protein [Vibrio chagasii]
MTLKVDGTTHNEELTVHGTNDDAPTIHAQSHSVTEGGSVLKWTNGWPRY